MKNPYEDEFTMTDKDTDGNTVTFGVIEDESGDVYWAYGHEITPEMFQREINRWLKHSGIDVDSYLIAPPQVDHRWAKYDPNQEEYFRIMDQHPVGPSTDHLVCNEEGCDYSAMTDPDFTSWDDHWRTAHDAFPVSRVML